VNSLFVEGFCPRAALVVVVRGRGFLIDLNVGTVFIRVAVTAGTSVHTTYGGNISFNIDLWFITSLWCL